MRGNLKTDEYFEEALRKTEERIEHLSETVEKACREHGKDFKGVKNGYAFLNTEYSKKFDILYTLGNHDEKLPEAFAGLLKYTVLSSDACIDVGWDLIKILSLAILMNTDPEDKDLKALLDKLREAQITDYLTDRLCKYLDPTWPYQHDTFRWKNTFEPLKPVLEDPDADAVRITAEFLQKRWMIIHKGAWWYGGHNDDKKPYYGYWAYECAAVVKILGLDDTILNGQKWYPYDLAHMTD